MTFDTNALLGTLHDRRTESHMDAIAQVEHRVDSYPFQIDGTVGIAAKCICGGYTESMGRDESSRNAIKAFRQMHPEVN